MAKSLTADREAMIKSILGNMPGKHYFIFMKTSTLEEPLTRIGREFSDLKHQVPGFKPRSRCRRQTVGDMRDKR